MATVTTVTTTYAGEAAAGYLLPCLLSPETVGNVTVHENVKHKLVLRNMNVADVLADATCDFTPVGTMDIDESILETKALEINMDQCKQDYIDAWEVLEMRATSHNIVDDTLPTSLVDSIILNITGLVGAAFENYIWNGSAAVAGQFSGFMLHISAAKSATPDVALPAAAITADNVIEALQNMYDAIPDCVFQKRDAAIYIPIATEKAYQTALGALGYMNQYTAEEKPLNFNGVPLLVSPGMLPKDMVAASKSDLHYGVNLLSDDLLIQTLDMGPIDGSRNVRFIAHFEIGTQISNPTDIVWGEFKTV